MAQVFLYPATGESPLDEDGNPFPSTGLRVTMNAYYEGQCRQGLLVRQDPSAFSSVAQPAVYAPFSLGYVTTQLSTLPISRDRRELTTVGYSTAGDPGGATWVGKLGVSSGANGLTKINTTDGQWQMLIAYDQYVSLYQLGCRSDAGRSDIGVVVMEFVDFMLAESGGSGGCANVFFPPVPGGEWFKQETTIYARGGNDFRCNYRGAGARIDGANPFGFPTWSDVVGTGSIVKVTALNVHAFQGDQDNPYSEMIVEGIGLIGPGRGTGVGIYIGSPGNGVCTTRGNVIKNFYTGIRSHNGISCKNHEQNIIFSCFRGIDVSGGIDNNFIGNRTEACNTGVLIRGGYNDAFGWDTPQGCAVGFQIGEADGTGWGQFAFTQPHFEVNGQDSGHFQRASCVTATTVNDTLSGLAARNGVAPAAGQRVLVTGQADKRQNGPYLAAVGAWTRADTIYTTHAGAVYEVTGGSQAGWWQIDNTVPAFLEDGDDLDIVQVERDWDMRFVTGASTVATSRITLERANFGQNNVIVAGNLRVVDCSNFELVVPAGGYCDASASGPNGATDWTIAPDCTFAQPLRQRFSATVNGGSYAYDWCNGGDEVSLLLTADSTIALPTNYRDRSTVRYRFKQDGTGGRRLTWNANIVGIRLWSDMANYAGSESSIAIQIIDGQWTVVMPQQPYWNYGNLQVGVYTAFNPPAQGSTTIVEPVHVAGTQTAISTPIARVTTVANANDSVTLPRASDLWALGGTGMVVVNEGANTLRVYPYSGEDLGAGIDAPATITAGASARFVTVAVTPNGRVLRL